MINKKNSFFIIITIISFWFIFLYIIPNNITNNNSQSIINGITMGTTYEVKVHPKLSNKQKAIIHTGIDSILFLINQSMSTYFENSEISILNKKNDKDASECYKVSEYFLDVITSAKKYNKITNGAFDPTIMPLLNIWGFRGSKNYNIPESTTIDNTMKDIGFDKVKIDLKNKCLLFDSDNLTLDFGAIAKGYAVDKISDFLLSHEINVHYIEIGGEILCLGKKWKISIAFPEFNSSKFFEVVNLRDMSIATSGTYNQFFEIDNFQFSHIFDARIGRPAKNNIISVSVISPKSIDSDALATSLKVLGVEKGLNLINGLEETECIFIVKEDNELKTYYSKNFLTFIAN